MGHNPFLNKNLPRPNLRLVAQLDGLVVARTLPRLVKLNRMFSLRSITEVCQTVCKPGSVPSLRAGMAIHLGRPLPSASRDRPERRRRRPARQSWEPGCLPLLLGLAPGGVYPATAVAGGAVRSYRTISPLPPISSQGTGWARRCVSVALSLGSPPPGVTRHRASVEPGLSSLRNVEERPSDRLAWENVGSHSRGVKCSAIGQRNFPQSPTFPARRDNGEKP
jgi:hypothetical protein